jgi:hypothetical protein
LNGSASNLVTVEHDRFGQPHFKCAFNTQTCEQLNAWLGRFQSILNRMTAGNFDWFLHTMLCLHTQRILERKSWDLDEDDSSDDSD